MERIFPSPKNTVFITGLSSIALSLVLFLLPPPHKTEGMFLVNFAIAVIYGIFLFIVHRWHKDNNHHGGMACWLVLCLISCYALNRQMNLLDRLTPWFAVLQCIAAAQLLAYAWFDYLPGWGKYVFHFISGVSSMVFLYLACFLLPTYLLGAAICWAMGFSLHTFVPLFCCVFIYNMSRKTAMTNRFAVSFFSGAGMVLLICIVHIMLWNTEVKRINLAYQRTLVKSETMLPPWMTLSQQLPHNLLTEHILQTDLVYATPDFTWTGMFWRMPHRNYTEPVQHDPLVIISSLFSGPVAIPVDDRISILESLYDKRQAAQERLWRGDDLQTTFVNTAVQLWPALHLAYTEMNVSVRNDAPYSWRGEEAIYTFHVPEGGVVTSLSLWIDGKESKGVLTSKEKADSAYKTVVGVEIHDPSVVHWQEGNTVTVRVFPVPANSERMFKIGISAPLPVTGQQLTYAPVYFEGPITLHAQEDASIELKQTTSHLSMPAGFSQTDPRHFTRSGHYRNDWACTFDAPALDEKGFVFDGMLYALTPLPDKQEPVVTKAVYLDINASWSPAECDQVFDLVKDRPIFVYPGADEPLERVTAANKTAVFEQLQRNHFSLFPFYEIPKSTTALVITKNAGATPSLKDLHDAGLLDSLKTYFNQQHKIRLFDLGEMPSAYLASLKTCRTFNYQQGTVSLLEKLLKAGTFTADQEDSNRVIINSAGLAITRQPALGAHSQAPDHLMRLFAFNDILRRSGPRLLMGPVQDSSIIEEAKQAYVVSPVSSLIVLETSKDYERFGIADSKNSLQNASLKSKGAVPEPAEWALIIMVVGLLLYVRFAPIRKSKLSV